MARAKSKLRIRYENAKNAEQRILAAVALYERSKSEALLNDKKVPSYAEIAQICSVPRETLRRRVAKLPSRINAAAERGWLTASQSAKLIHHILDCADKGFPNRRKDIERHALEIARIAHPKLTKLGPHWVDRFLARHHDELTTHWTANLEHSRAAGVNSTSIPHWFDLLEATCNKYNFAPECVYAFDESGFPFGGDGMRVRVVGRKDTKIQHIQRGGNRENVTVMVTICADGTTVCPTVLFKGKRMYQHWSEHNTLGMKYVGIPCCSG